MSNIISRPHMRHAMRSVPESKRKQIQYDTDKRREEQGKTVIHLHEKTPAPKCGMPTDAEMAPRVLAWFAEHGDTPKSLTLPFAWAYPDHGFAVQGLPPHADDLSGRYGRTGRWVTLRVTYDPAAAEVRLG